MKDIKKIFELAFYEYLQGKYTVKILKEGYQLKPGEEKITSAVDAFSHARNILMYEWFTDNNCGMVIDDLYDYILIPETPIDLSGVPIKAMVFTVSPETMKVSKGK